MDTTKRRFAPDESVTRSGSGLHSLAQVAPLGHGQVLFAVKARPRISSRFDLLGEHALVPCSEKCNRTDLVQVLAN